MRNRFAKSPLIAGALKIAGGASREAAKERQLRADHRRKRGLKAYEQSLGMVDKTMEQSMPKPGYSGDTTLHGGFSPRQQAALDAEREGMPGQTPNLGRGPGVQFDHVGPPNAQAPGTAGDPTQMDPREMKRPEKEAFIAEQIERARRNEIHADDLEDLTRPYSYTKDGKRLPVWSDVVRISKEIKQRYKDEDDPVEEPSRTGATQPAPRQQPGEETHRGEFVGEQGIYQAPGANGDPTRQQPAQREQPGQRAQGTGAAPQTQTAAERARIAPSTGDSEAMNLYNSDIQFKEAALKYTKTPYRMSIKDAIRAAWKARSTKQ